MLQCDDIEVAKNWYESTLGFRCVSRLEQNWCRLERDGAALMFMRNAHLGPPRATATQYIYVRPMRRGMGSRTDALWDARISHQRSQWVPAELWSA